MTEKRSFLRIPVNLGVAMTIGSATYDRYFIDMSLGGAQITHETHITAGSNIRVCFTLPNATNEPINVTAKARWYSSGALGIAFDGFRAREVWLLNHFFRSMH
jgi:hypothetical protein